MTPSRLRLSRKAKLSLAFSERPTFSPSKAFSDIRPWPSFQKQSFHSPAASELPIYEQSFHAAALRGLLLASPKSNQKAMRLSRCSDSHPANRNEPALLAAPGSLRQCIHALHRDRGDPSPRPVGPFPSRLRCSAPLDGASCLLIRPSLDYVFSGCEFWLLRQDAAKPGPLWGGERREESRRLRCQHRYVLSAQPERRERTWNTWMCGKRPIGVAFSWVTFSWPCKRK